ncbi:TrbI/VirB10 family protein [Brevundimonas nasdae]|uniref:TrbI/VirB10 family protein n=1 Tax=Brevundimonas nasdae TaxID=172043 RepID=UPI000691BDC1|nr:TrbI/VirB10 family protein [Brevundimonas nasdae]
MRSLTSDGGRISQLGRHSRTIPQGALIPAVLETSLDSSRPGFVRAVVSRDVRGFDGSHVLIPRGSRLIGEYRSDTSPGQNRAFIQWTRLLRPDGVSLAIDSPAADGLGGTGVKGRVDSHFLERFGATILQSTLNIGVALAGRHNGGAPVVVALPGSTAQTEISAPSAANVRPTLRVDAGNSITVFVAHDLELPPADAR